MAERGRSLSTIWMGVIFAALLGGAAYSAFTAKNALVGGLLSVVGLVVLAGSLRRPPKEGPSLRTHVVWTGLGYLVAGAAFITMAVLDDSPGRALAGLAGAGFLGLAIFTVFLLWKTRHIEEAADAPDPESAT